jgi:Tfp pilus assembly protein PilN
MRAVNLVPLEERRGASAPGRSGADVYAALGILALLVIVAGAYVLASNSLNDKRAQLARTQQEAKVAEARAGSLRSYTQLTALREKRAQTVQILADSRFDWARALHEVARTLPRYAWLTSMRATVTPDVKVDGGQTDPLRQSLAAPAIELLGCAGSQDDVAGVIASMRGIDGVQRVSLSSSTKSANAAPSGAARTSSGAAAGGGCQADARAAQFSMTVFFDAPASTSAAPATETTK